jgi:hypothetical protein
MSSQAINGPDKLANSNFETVWFEGNGSSDVSVYEGQGVCYNWDYGTAADADARRYNHVELPTILNAPHFAGVLAEPQTIPATGKFVRIYLPGSVCQVLAMKSLTIGVGRVTCQAGGTYAGYFTAEGFEGKGSAVPLQTLDTSATAALTLVKLEEGAQSGLVEVLTATAGGATVCMVGGITHFATATVASDATFTVADGTKLGVKKGFVIDGTQTTSNIVITINGIRVDGSTALVSWTSATAGHSCILQWMGDWYQIGTAGGTPA